MKSIIKMTDEKGNEHEWHVDSTQDEAVIEFLNTRECRLDKPVTSYTSDETLEATTLEIKNKD